MPQYPIIYQCSLPRSGSTSVLRSMEAQGIFDIYHEPSIRPYEVKNRWLLSQFMFRSGHPIDTFDKLERTLLEKSHSSPLYVKDIIHSSAEWLVNSQLLSNPNVIFVFLVRNPYDQLVSLCKQFDAMGIPPKMVENVFDYDILANLIEVCRKRAPERCIVMQTECICSYPKEMIKIISEKAGLNLKNVILEWEKKPANFDGTEWHESKKPDSFRKWHHDAINSTRFLSLPTYPQNWSQFSDPQWAKRIVAKNNAAYQRIFACAQ